MARGGCSAAVALSAVLTLTPATGQTRDRAIGIVTTVSGAWMLVGRAPARVGDLLFVGSTLTIPRSTMGVIEVVMLDTARAWRQECTETSPCEGVYPLPSSAPRRRGFLAFVADYWHSRRDFPPVFAAVRGDSVRLPATAVPAGPRVDLTSMAAAIGVETFTIHLAAAPGAPGTLARPIGQRISRRPGESVSIDGPPPGLYLVTISDADDRMIGGPSVLFVSTSAAAANRQLDELRSAMAGWPNLTQTTRDHMIIRALYALAGGSSPN